MPTVVEEARTLVERRLADLDEEKGRLERALSELSNGNGLRRSPGRPRTPGAKPKQRRQRKGGTRADQTVAIIAAKDVDGITGGDIAKQLGIKPNYLYRILDGLVKEGKVKKDGRKYFPVS